MCSFDWEIALFVAGQLSTEPESFVHVVTWVTDYPSDIHLSSVWKFGEVRPTDPAAI